MISRTILPGENGKSAQDLLDGADKGLYQSKANGRDRVTLASK
jgi:PleD family two-component response regulator